MPSWLPPATRKNLEVLKFSAETARGNGKSSPECSFRFIQIVATQVLMQGCDLPEFHTLFCAQQKNQCEFEESSGYLNQTSRSSSYVAYDHSVSMQDLCQKPSGREPVAFRQQPVLPQAGQQQVRKPAGKFQCIARPVRPLPGRRYCAALLSTAQVEPRAQQCSGSVRSRRGLSS